MFNKALFLLGAKPPDFVGQFYHARTYTLQDQYLFRRELPGYMSWVTDREFRTLPFSTRGNETMYFKNLNAYVPSDNTLLTCVRLGDGTEANMAYAYCDTNYMYRASAQGELRLYLKTAFSFEMLPNTPPNHVALHYYPIAITLEPGNAEAHYLDVECIMRGDTSLAFRLRVLNKTPVRSATEPVVVPADYRNMSPDHPIEIFVSVKEKTARLDIAIPTRGFSSHSVVPEVVGFDRYVDNGNSVLQLYTSHDAVGARGVHYFYDFVPEVIEP